MKKLLLFSFLMNACFFYCILFAQSSSDLNAYADALRQKGDDPLPFVLQKLDSFDLILFDDALHTAVEPFEFYQTLVQSPAFRQKAGIVFLEAVSINQQPALDAYFASSEHQPQLLYPAFQNDFSGTGWPYKTYFDLLESIWRVNAALPPGERIKVFGVNAPVYWKEILTPKDVELFRLSISGNDYTMYKTVLSYLDNFMSGKKGILITNTRHAYKGIKNKQGKLYLNCGTFFTTRHSGKTCSVRFHNINLFFESQKKVDAATPKTTEGLENVRVRWVRMADGLWDSAFETVGYKPVALDIAGTPFGKTDYIGNHMLNAAPGQTMSDAYDALIFLKPVEKMRQTAMVDAIYTDDFKIELERRINILYTEEQRNEILNQYGFQSTRQFIDQYFIFKPEVVQPLAKDIGPIDAWKK